MARRLIYKGVEYTRNDGKHFSATLRIRVENIYRALEHNDLKGYNAALHHLERLEPVISSLRKEIKNEIREQQKIGV